ncbi:hypothetical protein CFE70_007043 [Pyrenophora teres f. teres 0-1]|uniref:Hypervirulence associated protein TUDOR domain-containing protein n=2 Tax=Pyrenophora teres f. teres TaxID=97479 RepID=E3RU40_PYRTT|nr:hypothetical protein PTT_12580 [Pyrenophora teres f. teres 0-1]KAE8822274.1 hypothetical protein HRS9139_10295 [Pyrenophora teres f. teres]KAE8835061.1 hypothetical protein PTNB85_06394 [Pyrenophora teres f. teres]KAE8861350.1 hypothetical protein PTNB29_06445 [Pyrenophora teres f. teres]KAK1908402.1 hypothetical protein P3342_009251 [Pyrenophora teres f. teres]
MANRLSHSLDEIESHTPAIKSHDGNTCNDIMSKNGETIKEGDHVYTKIRGGRHEGDVEKIVTNKDEADAAGVKHPPKVLFTDQKGKDVAHNPGTLDVTDKA